MKSVAAAACAAVALAAQSAPICAQVGNPASPTVGRPMSSPVGPPSPVRPSTVEPRSGQLGSALPTPITFYAADAKKASASAIA